MDRETPLGEVHKYIRERIDKGADCPACGQRVQRYHRKFSASMGHFLIQIYRAAHRKGNAKSWVHFKNDLGPHYRALHGGEYSVVAHYGMIESKPHQSDHKRKSGYWRMTDVGLAFVCDQSRVPSHVYTYNARPRGFDTTELVCIRDVLGRYFNYLELMRGI